MELNELKNILTDENNGLIGYFTDNDIDFFIIENIDENNYRYARVNGVCVPFRRICLGLQDLDKKGTNAELLFIFKRQCQIPIKDIDSLEFNVDVTAF